MLMIIEFLKKGKEGYNKKIWKSFNIPKVIFPKPNLKDSIFDLRYRHFQMILFFYIKMLLIDIRWFEMQYQLNLLNI